jgi:hypothetical protein
MHNARIVKECAFAGSPTRRKSASSVKKNVLPWGILISSQQSAKTT